MGKGFSNSIGGGSGSAAIQTNSITWGDGNLNAQAHDQAGRQASEPVRKVPMGPARNGAVSGGSGADAKSNDSTRRPDRMASSNKVRI